MTIMEIASSPLAVLIRELVSSEFTMLFLFRYGQQQQYVRDFFFLIFILFAVEEEEDEGWRTQWRRFVTMCLVFNYSFC